MDYCVEALNESVIFSKRFNENLLAVMECESDYIMTCLESNLICKEEPTTILMEASLSSLWQAIKDFFARIFGIFKQKAKAIVDNDKQWMDENFNKLEKINYEKLKIEMTPFWNMTLDNMRAKVGEMENSLRSIATDASKMKKYEGIEDLKKGPLKSYLDSEGNLTNGMKNIFIWGSPNDVTTTVLSGNTLKDKIQVFKQYCFNYQKDVQPFVQGLMNKAEQEIQAIENLISKSVANESFCLIENCLYSETELRYCMEAVDGGKADPKAENNGSAKPTQVKIVNGEKEDQANKDKAEQPYKGMKTDHLQFAKNVMQVLQTNITALMTVLEQKYRAYMNALKEIVKEAGEKVTNETPEDKVKNSKI